MPGRNHRETLLLTVDQIGDRFADVGEQTLVSDLARELNGSDRTVQLSIYSHRLGVTFPAEQPVRLVDIRSGDVIRVVLAEAAPPARTGSVELAKPAPEAEEPARAEPEQPEPEPEELGGELQMLSGGLTGITYPLSQGENSVGRVSDNDVVVVDAGVSRHHATISLDAGVITVTDNGSTNGIRIDGLPIKSPTVLESGQRFLLGSCWACIVARSESQSESGPADEAPPFEGDEADVPEPYSNAAGDEIARLEEIQRATAYARPARQESRFPEQVLTLPAPPTLGGRRRQAGKDQTTVEQFRAAVDAMVVQLEAGLQVERQSRLAEAPPIEAVIDAVLDRSLLWQRHASDVDGLDVRLGLATQPSRTKLVIPPGGDAELRSIVAELRERFRSVSDVPVVVNLRQAGSLVIQGSADAVSGLATSLIGQLAALHGPDQLGLAYRAAGERSRHWDWLKWLPHVDIAGSRTGLSEDGYVGRLSELLNQGPARLGGPLRPRAVVFLIDDPASLPPALFRRLLDEGPDAGLYSLLLAEDDVSYQGTLGAIVRVDMQTATLATTGDDQIGTISVERTDRATVLPAAREMASLRYAEALAWPAGSAEMKPDADHVSVDRFELGGTPPPRWEDDDALEDASLPAAVPGGTAEAPVAPQVPRAPDVPQAPRPRNAPKMPQMPTKQEIGLDPASNGGAAPIPTEPPLLLSALPPAKGDGRLVLGTVQVEGRPNPAVFAMNLPRDRSLGLLGKSGVGRSNALLVVAAAAASLNVDPDQVPVIYYLDVPGELAMLKSLPNAVGAVRNDIDSYRAITAAMADQLVERRTSFVELGAFTLDEYRQRRPDGQLRRVLVLIDDFVALRELMEALQPGQFSELMGDLFGDGARLGMHVVFTAERRADVDDDLDPRVGRWLTLGGGQAHDVVRPGRAVVGNSEVRFAMVAESEPAQVFSALGEDLLARGATPIAGPTGPISTTG